MARCTRASGSSSDSSARADQVLILAAFEEEGWPDRIDDPLPPLRDINPKCRLHDTIKWLNRNQEIRLLQFSGDGKGQGVRWKILVAGAVAIAADTTPRVHRAA